ncbi:GtrA family protein [Planctomycetota bacterium]
MFRLSRLRQFRLIRFAATSVLVTATDYLIFFALLRIVGPVSSNIISYCCALCFSFYLHRTFVFEAKRKVSTSFVYVIIFSVSGTFISTGLLLFYNYIVKYIVAAKIFTTMTMFIYNYTTKRIAFADGR